VLSDIIDCAQGRYAHTFGVPTAQLKAVKALPDAECKGSFYVRLQVKDQSGVLADIAGVMRDAHISIQSLLQKGKVPVVFITHESNEKAIAEAVAALKKLPTVLQEPVVIRIFTN
jgi:homoserine dehydrogenase